VPAAVLLKTPHPSWSNAASRKLVTKKGTVVKNGRQAASARLLTAARRRIL